MHEYLFVVFAISYLCFPKHEQSSLMVRVKTGALTGLFVERTLSARHLVMQTIVDSVLCVLMEEYIEKAHFINVPFLYAYL